MRLRWISTRLLNDGARALAHGRDLDATLRAILIALCDALDVGSSAVFAADPDGSLSLIASTGLGEAAAAALADAVANPAHPVARTAADPVATFDVLPMAPGGPALRSHVPLVVTQDGTETVLGVLALAHDRWLDGERAGIQAAADLAAVALERHLPRP